MYNVCRIFGGSTQNFLPVFLFNKIKNYFGLFFSVIFDAFLGVRSDWVKIRRATQGLKVEEKTLFRK